KDADYCVHCVVFPGANKRRGQLASEPFRNWILALEVFTGHFTDAKRNQKDGGNVHQAQQLNCLQPLCRTKRQSPSIIALRGIRDDSKYINEAVSNCVNFQALLEFRAGARDLVLKEHIATAHKNHTTKNDICKILDAYENKIYAHLMKE
ncbi:hypothetical protein MAR_017384, partial [Mya arenaria]